MAEKKRRNRSRTYRMVFQCCFCNQKHGKKDKRAIDPRLVKSALKEIIMDELNIPCCPRTSSKTLLERWLQVKNCKTLYICEKSRYIVMRIVEKSKAELDKGPPFEISSSTTSPPAPAKTTETANDRLQGYLECVLSARKPIGFCERRQKKVKATKITELV